MNDREPHPRFGTEFDWMCVDTDGLVAVFATEGYGPCPSKVLDHVGMVDDAVDSIRDVLPVLEWNIHFPRPDFEPPLRSSIEFAQRGLFAFEWFQYHGPFNRLACPLIPISINQLPADLKTVAEFCRLPISFSRTEWFTLPYEIRE